MKLTILIILLVGISIALMYLGGLRGSRRHGCGHHHQVKQKK
ncbi:MAG: hypothetical protein ACI304_07425 [Lepagella sp.]